MTMHGIAIDILTITVASIWTFAVTFYILSR